MISGKTRLIGVIGWPIGHSLSPFMQNAAFQALGLDYAYGPLAVAPQDLDRAVEGLKAVNFAGFNVTVPHKVNIMPFLDEVDVTALTIGAINTVVINQGRTAGYNTDAAGFVNSLAAAGIRVAGQKAVLLGAGGAARAVACGLLQNGAAGVVIGARDRTKAAGLAEDFAGPYPVGGCGLTDDRFRQALSACDILVNCTPLGMHPHPAAMPPLNWQDLKASAVVCDLIYNPAETVLLAEAKKRGHTTVNGTGMLIEQGALAFTLWTGQPAPRSVMREALQRELSIS